VLVDSSTHSEHEVLIKSKIFSEIGQEIYRSVDLDYRNVNNLQYILKIGYIYCIADRQWIRYQMQKQKKIQQLGV
jgi:hypothetical protein